MVTAGGVGVVVVVVVELLMARFTAVGTRGEEEKSLGKALRTGVKSARAIAAKATRNATVLSELPEADVDVDVV